MKRFLRVRRPRNEAHRADEGQGEETNNDVEDGKPTLDDEQNSEAGASSNSGAHDGTTRPLDRTASDFSATPNHGEPAVRARCTRECTVPNAAAVPDLSNLWSRRKSSEGFYLTSKRNAVHFYPKLREHTLRVPPTEALLTKNLQYCKKASQIDPTTPSSDDFKSRTQQTKKPGAVSVSGDSQLPQQAKFDLDLEGKTAPLASLAAFVTTDSGQIFSSPNSSYSIVAAAKLATLDFTNSNDSVGCKKPSPKLTSSLISTGDKVERKPVGGATSKSSLLDDDDELEIPDFASLAVPVSTSTSMPLIAGGAEPPTVWGRKAKKSTLEEDIPDSLELAFAGSTGISFMPKPHPSDATDNEEQVGRRSSVSIAKASVDDAPSPKSMKEKGQSMGISRESTEDEQLLTALRESQKQHLQQKERKRAVTSMSREEIEDTKDTARSLRSIISSDDVDIGFLQTVLDMCRVDQKKVAREIEEIMNQDGVETDLEVLIDMNNFILDAIESGERIASDNQKPAPKKRNNLDVEDLVENKDIFSLICMLRVQQNEKSLDAALALMKFARVGESRHNDESLDLRDEIRSSGGLHSLLTLFRTRGTPYKLRVVTALAVAYVVPSFVDSSSQTPPSLGLKIVECLRFLTTAHSVSHNGEVLDQGAMFKASTMALATFWVNILEPMLNSKKLSLDSESLIMTVSLGRQRSRDTDHRQDYRRDAIALDELLEVTVSLIIYVAKHEADDTTHKWSYTLVEQVCAVEIVRPIAVREGILHLLVSWIRSKDLEKIRPAASALRYVTSINDKYMAGWIHSEMVNKGAVQCLADLTRDIAVTRDIRLEIAQILSSLCAAPHTRAAVVEANCINFLIGVLYEHSDPSSEEVALFAGRAILQLAAGAITRASAFRDDDLEVFNSFVSSHKRDTLIR